MKKKIIYAALAVVLIFVIAFLGDAFGIGGSKSPVAIKIADGSGSNAIANDLKDAGIIKSASLFKVYAKITGEPLYQKGVHILNDSMSFGKIIKTLESAPKRDEYKILIPEGYELSRILDVLEESNLINRDVFMSEIQTGNFNYSFIADIPQRENRLEGYLYPDTYIFTSDMTEKEIIDAMLQNFNNKVIPVYEESGTDKSLDEIITLASIVEREAANDEERGKVASVFVNRLNKGMKLESCATIQYVLGERKSVLTNADTQIDSPYNTYKNSGLPIGPIASPGLKSIQAALHPENTDYLYFLAGEDLSYSLFATTFEEHLANQQNVTR